MPIDVMVVEDEPMVREIICEYVAKQPDFQVAMRAGSGREALAKLSRQPVELLILDIHMPGLNGVEFLTKLRAEGNDADVIFLTASTDTAMISAALTLGAADYVIKPFTYERFVQALANYRRRYILLRGGGEATQDELDRVFAGVSGGEQPLQKGVHPKTLSSVRAYVADGGGAVFSQQDVADALGLSKVTVRKYLEYMVALGELEMGVEYGTVGRPMYTYWAKNPPHLQ